MSITRKLLGVGAGPMMAQAIVGVTDRNKTATGTDRATAYLLSDDVTTFSVVPSGTGASLRADSLENDVYTVVNNGANDLNVYPPLGGTVGGGAVNAPYVVAAGVLVEFQSMGNNLFRVKTDSLSSLAAPTGSSLIGFTQSGVGAVPRTVQSKLRDEVSVKDFGATGDGTTDDTAAIQAAITAQTNGGNVFFPPGVYRITNTLAVQKPGIRLIGSGRDDNHSFTPSYPNFDNTGTTTSLLWKGASGGTMISVEPSSTEAAGIGGNSVVGMNLISSEFPHTSAAAIGVSVKAAYSGEYDIFCLEFSTAGLFLGARNLDSSIYETSTRFNRVKFIGARNFSTSGAGLKLDGVNLSGNAYNNIFEVVSINHLNGNGVDLGSCDNNIFLQTRITRAAGGSGAGLIMRSSVNADGPARANIFLLLSPGAGGALSDASLAYPAYENKILFYNPDENSSPSVPTVSAGSSLFYNTTKKVGSMNFGARLASDQVISPAAVWVGAEFATATYNPSGWYDTTNRRWTPRYPGLYQLNLLVYATPASNVNGQLFQVRIVDNTGASLSRSVGVFNGTTAVSVSISCQAEIPLGGWVKVEVRQNTGVNVTLDGTNTDVCVFQGSKLS